MADINSDVRAYLFKKFKGEDQKPEDEGYDTERVVAGVGDTLREFNRNQMRIYGANPEQGSSAEQTLLKLREAKEERKRRDEQDRMGAATQIVDMDRRATERAEDVNHRNRSFQAQQDQFAADSQWRQSQAAAEAQRHKDTMGLNWSKLNQDKAESQAKSASDSAKATDDFRKEYNNNPTTKNTASVSEAYNKVISASDTPQGDLSLIFGYMKMLDPGSVVREGEFANAENTAGVPDRIRNAYNRALTGERLNPEMRNGFKSEARNVLDAQIKSQSTVNQFYDPIIQGRGLDPGQVINPAFRPQQLPPTPGQMQPTQRPSKPKTVIQNGHTYILNEATGEYE